MSCLSGKCRFFPGFPQLCHTSTLRFPSWRSAPVLSLGSDLQSLSLSTQPSPASMVSGQASQVRSAGQHWSLYRILSTLLSTNLLLCSPLRLWSPFPSFSMRGFWVCAETFTPPQLPPKDWGPILIPLSLLFLISFTLPHYVEISMLFFEVWGLAVSIQFSRNCSKCRYIFDVFVVRKVIANTPPPFWRSGLGKFNITKMTMLPKQSRHSMQYLWKSQ